MSQHQYRMKIQLPLVRRASAAPPAHAYSLTTTPGKVTHVTGACISTVTRARVRINQNKCHMRHLSSIGPVGFFFYLIDFNADKAARSIFSSQAVASGLEVLPEPLGATGVFA